MINYIKIQNIEIKNILYNTLILYVTFGFLIDGATLTETVFTWRGMGRFIFDSLLLMDYPVIQAMFLIIAITAVLANFVADLLYGVLDPRIKYG